MGLILLKSQLSHFLLLLSLLCSCLLVSCLSSSHIRCRSQEKSALLQFRSHFSCDPSLFGESSASRALNWKEDDEDCCEWDGVSCDNNTGNVVELYLNYDGLYGKFPLNGSLFNLIHLENLDLHGNNFENSQISPLFGNFRNLTNLSLDHSRFSGVVPNEIFQLPNLQMLVLSWNERLSGELPDSIGELASLQVLYLSGCNFSGPVPESIGNLRRLSILKIHNNHFSGELPDSIGELASLQELYLSGCNFSGPVPESIGNLTQLYHLDIHNNHFSGELPASLANVNNIQYLDISNNNLEGPLVLSNYNLSRLYYLDLSGSRFTSTVDLDLFKKPKWLEHLVLSRSGLSVTTNSSNFLSALPFLHQVGLSSCDLSTNILANLSVQSQLQYVDLSNNSMGNELDPLICNVHTLEYLDLSHNQLNGLIPDCLGNSNGSLSMLNLQSNKFYGIIPPSFGYLKSIQVLDLSNNVLQGSLPQSLANCTQLEVLNLGGNMLTDRFPFWLGNLSSLRVLILRENKINGTMSNSLSRKQGQFQNMHIIDMSNNDLIGTFPEKFFDSWRSMMIVEKGDKPTYESLQTIGVALYSYYYSLNIMNKGSLLSYQKVLTSMKVVDFSINNFHGSIPPSVGRLKGIQVLNLSGNSLTGQIPQFLENLINLESLDLSDNMFSGEIPSDLSNLNFLEDLNLSQNNLSGELPGFCIKFPNASYEGNQGLCGLPLSRPCRNVDKLNSPPQSTLPSKKKNKHHFEINLNEFGWEVVVGLGGGLVFGLVMGYFIPVENNHRVATTFNLKVRKSGRRAKNSRSR